jgi:hypothetical protein
MIQQVPRMGAAAALVRTAAAAIFLSACASPSPHAVAKSEEGMLRDLGYANARLPRGGTYDFDPGIIFPTAGPANSALLLEFDDQPGVDLLVLEVAPAGNVLRVYSGLDASRSASYVLPGLYTRMTGAKVGPRRLDGVVLASSTQETLLALAGLVLRPGQSILRKSDFRHVHAVAGPQSGLANDLRSDGRIAMAELDGYDGPDVLAVSRRHGLVPFLSDAAGHYDRLGPARTLTELAGLGVELDLSAYETGNGVGLDIPYGLFSNPGVASYVEGVGHLRHNRVGGTQDGYRVLVLARAGVVGFAALQSLATPAHDLARIRIVNDSSYLVEQRWRGLPAIADIQVLEKEVPEEPLEAVFSTSQHTIEKIALTGDAPQRVAGSAPGHRDGPAATALFRNPSSLCVQGRQVYIVDAGNFAIRRLDLQQGTVATLAGTPSVAGAQDGSLGTGSFRFASGAGGANACAVLGDSLYVLDSQGRSGPFTVRKLNINDGSVTTLPADALGPIGQPRSLQAHARRLFFLKKDNDGKSTVQVAGLLAPTPVGGVRERSFGSPISRATAGSTRR